MRHGSIDYNPLRGAERPIRPGRGEKPKIRILSASEINKFSGVVKNQKYCTLFMLAIMSGARQGELFGLKWPDIDWKNNQIHIQRTFNNQQWYDTQTKASNRKIDSGPAMIKELKKWKLACPPTDLDLVFSNQAGGPINHNNMANRYFEPALKKAKISKIRFHDLRYTYAHPMKPTNQEAACRLENAVFETSGSKTVADTKKGIKENSIIP